jgi:iron complex outermembrane recepter protein
MTLKSRGCEAAFVSIGFFVAMTLADSAAAQQPAAAADAELQEVTVTGSRIVRRDLEASSPIVTVSDKAFTESSTIGIESVLNQLPQFVPGASQFTTGDIFPSATNTPGIATLNLRGLGANRNLVLIDGRRGQPANSTLVIDTNTIPSSAVESVEIISGGASATYGADAMGGVTNFKLKSNFSGAAIEMRTGMTEQGDGEESRVSTMLGANLGEGRGNAMIGLEWTKRDAVLQADRDFYSRAFTDPNTGSLAAIRINAGKYQPSATNAPSQTAANAQFPDRPAGTAVSRTTPFYFNPDGSLYKDTNALGFDGTLNDGTYRLRSNGVLVENYKDGRISSPLTRYSIFGKADYEITSKVKTFAQMNFVRTEVNSVNQVTGVDGGFSASIPYGNGIYGPSVDAQGNTLAVYQAGGAYGLNCPAVGGCTKSQAFPVPAALAALLNARGANQFTTSTVTKPVYDQATGQPIAQTGIDSNWSLGGTTFYMPGRELNNKSQLFQVLAGLEGDLGFSDWTWEAYISHGETQTDNNYLNYTSLRRYQAVVQSPNYGKGFSQAAAGSSSAACTSGLPIFTSQEVSADCIAAINQALTDRTRLSQDIVEVNLQGGLFDLPAGELRGAVGLSYRKNDFSYLPDSSRETNSIIDIPAGSFAQANVFGETNVKEAYTEFLVPLLRDKPFVKSLELELGFRMSDYNTAGSVPTYKGLFSWTPIDYVRFRGGYQVANRAPNINELFLGESANPVVTRGPDPCRVDTRDFNGNVVDNPDRAKVQALCSALIGNPASTFDADPFSYRGDGRTDGGEIELRSGNLNLESEEGKTYTLGVILSSPFESAALSNMTFAVDYYSVKITDAISFVTAQTTYDLCFNRDRSSNPTYSIDDPNAVCRNIVRDETSGNRLYVNSAYANLGIVQTSGLDFQFDWRAGMEDIGLASVPGALSFNVTLNKLLKYDAQDFPTQAPRETEGTLAEGGQFSFRSITNLRYSVGAANVGLMWRHLPSVRSATYVTDPATTVLGAKSYSIFNLSGGYNIGSVVQITGGIDNLFDKEPNIVGAGQIVTRPDGTTSVLDGVGNTNAGYYDALGRRYYVALKLSF